MIVALDMLDDPNETRPYIERLMAQILGPIRRVLNQVSPHAPRPQ